MGLAGLKKLSTNFAPVAATAMVVALTVSPMTANDAAAQTRGTGGPRPAASAPAAPVSVPKVEHGSTVTQEQALAYAQSCRCSVIVFGSDVKPFMFRSYIDRPAAPGVVTAKDSDPNFTGSVKAYLFTGNGLIVKSYSYEQVRRNDMSDDVQYNLGYDPNLLRASL